MTTRRTVVIAGSALAAGQALWGGTPDWPLAAPEAQGLRGSLIQDALKSGEEVAGLRALLVAHRSTLVAERYYGGANADALQPINSATKSVCSMLVGLAVQDGSVRSLDDTIEQLLPEAIAEVPDSAVRAVTLRQILSGRSGFDFDLSQFGQLAASASLTRYALTRPGTRLTLPGWSYNDAMVSLIAPILSRAQGSNLHALAARRLFGKMGIARSEWRRDGEGNPLAPAGLLLRTRDLLKLAALMIDRGRWDGKQILPESWVAESLTPEGPASWTVRCNELPSPSAHSWTVALCPTLPSASPRRLGIHLPRIAAALAVVALVDVSAAGASRSTNVFGDPFGAVLKGLPGCPEPLGPAFTGDEALREVHGRAERGTSCYLSGRCRLPNSYHYDWEIFPRAVRYLRQDNRFADASIWLSVQRRWVTVYGCVRTEAQGQALEAALRLVDDVEAVLPELMVGPGASPPYRTREEQETQ